MIRVLAEPVGLAITSPLGTYWQKYVVAPDGQLHWLLVDSKKI